MDGEDVDEDFVRTQEPTRKRDRLLALGSDGAAAAAALLPSQPEVQKRPEVPVRKLYGQSVHFTTQCKERVVTAERELEAARSSLATAEPTLRFQERVQRECF